MSTTGIACPKCGAPNPPEGDYCYLCQEPFRPEPPQDVPEPAAEGTQDSPEVLAVAEDAGEEVPSSPIHLARPLSFYDAAASNVLYSQFLFTMLLVLFFAVGGTIGAATGRFNSGVVVSLLLYGILAGATWFGGSDIVLSLHDAREADPARDRQLLNVVEEMRIASGLPMPKVYVMETDGMNAFAAGRTPDRSAVAVTRGLLEHLDREELSGVIAHEMAHIKGRDTLYGICAAVLVGAVALLSDMFLRGSVFSRRTISSDAGRGSAVLVLPGLLLALLAPLAAKLLQMSISRQREYHADAGAAEFTRNPLGLASALEKIAQGGPQVPGGNRGTQHLFIVNPLNEFTERSSALLSTHPPTALRIQRLRAMAGNPVR